jgi:hypothetical protein
LKFALGANTGLKGESSCFSSLLGRDRSRHVTAR